MAHFAQIDSNNKVIQLIVVADEHEENGSEWCHNLLGGTWIQSSYNNRIRKQHAGVGYSYDQDADVFVQPQPFPSWSLDSNHDWQAPTPKPTNLGEHDFAIWNEETLSWNIVTEVWNEETQSWVVPDAE
jgi:hypothetical protein